jgi:plasmid maintenance system killer protein
MPGSRNIKIELELIPEVIEEAKRLNLEKKLNKAKRLFCENIRHPSLNFEKLEPKTAHTWSIRIDIHYRLKIIRDSESKFIGFDLSNHYK